jgi:hypothetical protein
MYAATRPVGSFAISVGLCVALFVFASRTTFWLTNWFYFVAVATFLAAHQLAKPEEIRKTEWERWLITAVPLILGVYGAQVYPRLKSQFGGGVPIPVVLHLTKKLPTFDSELVPTSLLDETEQGYYVTRVNDPDKAIFIVRSLVDEVEFLRKPPDNEGTQQKDVAQPGVQRPPL